MKMANASYSVRDASRRRLIAAPQVERQPDRVLRACRGEGPRVEITIIMEAAANVLRGLPCSRRSWLATMARSHRAKRCASRSNLLANRQVPSSRSRSCGRQSLPNWKVRSRKRLMRASTLPVRVGHPAETLVRMAEEEGCDLIVLGRRGLTSVQRWMLGSVSERVLRY